MPLYNPSGAGSTPKLDDCLAPDDNTDLNATTSAHGLMPKGTGSTTTFYRSDMTQATPTASVSAPFTGNQAPGANFTIATGQFGLHGARLTLASSERGTVEGTGRLVICG